MNDVTTAIVTGAGSRLGLGRAIALSLAHRGHTIAVLDIDETAALECAEGLKTATGVQTLGIATDVANPDSVEHAFRTVESRLPEASILVNNAGISASTRFDRVTLAEWNRIFDVNVVGTMLPTQRALPGMRARKYGRIVNISSVSGQRGGGVFGGAHYSASKAAILGFTKALARELAMSGVTVNAVAPGMADTAITGGTMTEDRKRELGALTLVGRLAAPADVANAVTFLATPESEYITGATIDVNAGLHLH